jgi:predicted nucleic acid-binding protein
VLVYAEGVNEGEMQSKALEWVERMAPHSVVVPAQASGALFHVLIRKGKRSSAQARAAVHGWQAVYETASTTTEVILGAADIAAVHGLSIWDSVILAAAANSGCQLLLSEDLQDGFTWRWVTVANPFASTPHPLLAAFLAGGGSGMR